MTSRIKQYLTQLYPEAPNLYTTLMARLEPVQTAPGGLFSQQDRVLITYGDSLLETGKPPLQALHSFAQQYLKDVFSTVHILPFYPFSSDDGFSVIDYYAVRDDLGTWDDVERIGADFDLMIDAVFNHMSAQSDWFKRFLAGDPEFDSMFRTESPDADLSSVTRPRATPLLTPFPKADGTTAHVWTTFSADQVDFDASSPQTILHLLDALLFYVAKGARIIRLDAIAYLWKEVGTSSIHLPQTHTVIQLMRAVLDVVAPQVLLVTETNVPHAENISYFGDGTNEAQMVYNFTLPPLLFHTLLAGDAGKLRDWVGTLQTPSPRTTFFNFTASHDGIGVRPVEGILSAAEVEALITHVQRQGGRVSYKRNTDGSQSPYELNCTYVDALTDPSEAPALQARRFLVSQGIMLALAGVPAVYIHSLLGSRNDLVGMEQGGYNRAINRAKLQIEEVRPALAQPDSFRAQVFNAYAHLLKVRGQTAAFHPQAAQVVADCGNDAVFGLLRGEAVLALFNISNQAQTADLRRYITGGAGVDLVSGERIAPQFTLAPYGVYWVNL